MLDVRARIRASVIHLGASAFVALSAAVVVFGVWYPYPFHQISGGRDLFMLVTCVDVVLGPLITFAIFNLAKPRAELRRDLKVVIALQLGALGYGMWTVAQARPVHLVFEIDRFRAVHAVEVDEGLLKLTPENIVAKPWTGPTLLTLRPFRDASERADATMAALQGVDLGSRPDLWRSYEDGRHDVIAASQPVTQLLARQPAASELIVATIREIGRDPTRVAYVPLVSRNAFWTVLVDPQTAEVLGYLPIDSF